MSGRNFKNAAAAAAVAASVAAAAVVAPAAAVAVVAAGRQAGLSRVCFSHPLNALRMVLIRVFANKRNLCFVSENSII